MDAVVGSPFGALEGIVDGPSLSIVLGCAECLAEGREDEIKVDNADGLAVESISGSWVR